ncbi:MAG: ATP-binding protein [Dehalococcoidales bacterium]|nr:ATP-binding protein [Dehalococcoidales bacterium]
MGVLYLVLPLIGLGFGVALAILVILQRPHSALHRVFAFFLVNMSLWALTIFFMRKSPLENALPWEIAIFTVLPFVSVSFYHSVLLLIGATKIKARLLVAYGFAVAAIGLAPTKLILIEMKPMWYGNGFVGGPLFIPYSIVFYGIVVLGLIELLRAHWKSESPIERNRYIYVAIGVSLCLMGLFSDMLAARGFPLYPLGIISNIFFMLFCSYAILKYHLLDMHLVIRRSMAYATISAILVGLVVALLYTAYLVGIGDWQLLDLDTIAVIIIIAVLLQPLIHWLQNRLDRFFYRSKYDYLRALETLGDNTKTITDFTFIADALVETVASAMKTDKVLLMIPDLYGKNYVPVAVIGQATLRSISLPFHGALTSWLQENTSIMTRHEIKVMPQLQGLTTHEKELLTELNAELLVPLMIRENLTGIIIMGRKLSDQDYSLEEIRMLRVVARQMATTLDNARLYKMQTERYLEQAFLTNLGMIVSSELDLDKVYNNLIKELKGFIDIDYVSINLRGEVSEPPQLAFVWTEKTLDQAGEEAIKQITGIPRLIEEVSYEPNLDTGDSQYNAGMAQIGIRSIMRLPLRSKGAVLGNFTLGSVKPQAYSEDNLRLLRQIALQLAIAVDNSRLYKLEKQAREDLQKEFEERAEFVDALIHEVKTPLTAMMASSELLKEELHSDNSVLSDLAANMDVAVRNLDRRITELVQFTKLQHTGTALNLEYLDINHLTNDAVAQVMAMLLNKNQTIKVEIEPAIGPIKGDPDRLMQVLLNLLTNAIKYGPPGDSLVLKAYRINNHAIIEMGNGAQPLTPGELEMIFTPYQRGRHKSGGGLGLGLFVCKKLVQLHGGKIWVETGKDGNHFKFSLPLDNQEGNDENPSH